MAALDALSPDIGLGPQATRPRAMTAFGLGRPPPGETSGAASRLVLSKPGAPSSTGAASSSPAACPGPSLDVVSTADAGRSW